MPDMISPLPGYNPNQTIGSLSTLLGMGQQALGMQQQRQALQTGQYIQASAQAQSQQDQQRNAELQALAQFSKNAIQDPNYHLPDGSLDTQKYQTGAMTVAPTYGAPVIGQQTANVRESIGTRQALQSLSAGQNAQITEGLKGLANIPGGATRSDLLNWKEQLLSNNKDPAFARAIDNALLSMQPDPGAGGYSGSAAKMAASLGGLSMQQPGQMDVGGSIQPTATTTMGPAVGQVHPTGGAYGKTLSPQLVAQPITGAPAVVGGGGGNTPRPVGPAGTPWQPTQGQPQNVAGMASDDAGRYQQVSAEGTNAQTGAQLADQVSRLSDEVRTGKLSKDWTDRLAVLQQHDPTLTARQMLSKYAAQLKTMATQGASTDAARSQIDEGMPSPETMGPDAVKEAAQYVGGIFRMRGARQAHADDFVKQNGGFSVGVRGADDTFMRAADPTIFAYNALPAGPQRQAFALSHGLTTPEKVKDFLSRKAQLESYGVK